MDNIEGFSIEVTGILMELLLLQSLMADKKALYPA